MHYGSTKPLMRKTGAVILGKLVPALIIISVIVALSIPWLVSRRFTQKSFRGLRAKRQLTPEDLFDRRNFDVVVIEGDVDMLRSLLVGDDEFSELENQSVRGIVAPGQLLLKSNLTSGIIGGDNELIDSSKRVLSVFVSISPGYYVRPGDKVDLWGNIDNKVTLIESGVCVHSVYEEVSIPGENSTLQRVALETPDPNTRMLLNQINGSQLKISLVGKCK